MIETYGRRAADASDGRPSRPTTARKPGGGFPGRVAAGRAGRACPPPIEICERPSFLRKTELPANGLGVQAILRPNCILLHTIEHPRRRDTHSDSVQDDVLALDRLVTKRLAQSRQDVHRVTTVRRR